MKADVCIILEGSYPYVVGGVSTWVHDLIQSLGDFTFAVIHIGVSKEMRGNFAYNLPKNVVDYREIHLLDPIEYWGPKMIRKEQAWEEFENFIWRLSSQPWERFEIMLQFLQSKEGHGINAYDILFSKRFWKIILNIYEKHFPHFSFIDFFWTLRFMLLPLFKCVYVEIPDVDIYHSSCTGYAGLLGCIAKINKGSPLILTEHGIYTNERMIEITQAKWIYREKPLSIAPKRQLGILQNLWMQKFKILSQIVYHFADEILTLYEGNRQLQILGGADSEKTKIIPNGIDPDLYISLGEERKKNLSIEGRKKIVSLVGRVAPIKDIKTFIRACKIVHTNFPDTEFYVLGTKDEDLFYFQECERLVDVLGLRGIFHFPGNVNMKEYYPKIDVMVLTSISEAQPFVMLEGMGVGIPFVATNVGACSELLYGLGQEDEKLGQAGIITNIASPEETAKGILKILQDKEFSKKLGMTGQKRILQFYVKKRMLDGYKNLYLKHKKILEVERRKFDEVRISKHW